MLSLMIYAGYGGSDHCRKLPTNERGLCILYYFFFLQYRHLRIPRKSPKKVFYCFNKVKCGQCEKGFFSGDQVLKVAPDGTSKCKSFLYI